MSIATPIFCAEQGCTKSGSTVTLSGAPALGHMSFTTAAASADIDLSDGDEVVVSLYDKSNHALYRATYNNGTLTLGDKLQGSSALQNVDILVASIGVSWDAFGAVAGSDYAKPDTESVWTARQTFQDAAYSVYTIAGNDVNPANGGIQVKTLSSNYIPTFSLETGQVVLLTLINANVNTVTWINVDKWYGHKPADFSPILTGDDLFKVWHDGTNICATYVGGA